MITELATAQLKEVFGLFYSPNKNANIVFVKREDKEEMMDFYEVYIIPITMEEQAYTSKYDPEWEVWRLNETGEWGVTCHEDDGSETEFFFEKITTFKDMLKEVFNVLGETFLKGVTDMEMEYLSDD